jgi:ubiquitin C-terminal hydrolase
VFGLTALSSDERFLSVCEKLERFGPNSNLRVDAQSSLTLVPRITNLGMTCYLAATLQQFFAIRAVRERVLKYAGDDPLLLSLQTLFAMVISPVGSTVSPEAVVNNWTLWDGQKLDRRVQQDAGEFCLMLVNKLLVLGEDDINRLFQVRLDTAVEGIEEEYHGTVTDSSFSLLLDVKDLSGLEESLQRLSSTDFFCGKEKYFAESLGRHIRARASSSISACPDHLMVTLKRFEYDFKADVRHKISTHFQFPTELDLTPFCTSPDANATYSLTGLILHSGEASCGHYESLVIHNNTWYLCDDTHIVAVDLEDRLPSAFGDSKSDYCATVLFYTRKTCLQEISPASQPQPRVDPVQADFFTDPDLPPSSRGYSTPRIPSTSAPLSAICSTSSLLWPAGWQSIAT